MRAAPKKVGRGEVGAQMPLRLPSLPPLDSTTHPTHPGWNAPLAHGRHGMFIEGRITGDISWVIKNIAESSFLHLLNISSILKYN